MGRKNEGSVIKAEIITDPIESAKAAGLSYVSDRKPGIRREERRKKFVYYDADGRRISDKETLDRIESLAIPPAWADVWICPSPRGHLQAMGHDARGRKQYRYHRRWRQTRDETKYNRMLAFGMALPAIRQRVAADLGLEGMPRHKVLATVVRLLEKTLIRVGNEEYAKENHSFGLTTLRNRHVDVEGSTLRFHFRGKSGVVHDVGISDRRVAPIIRKCQEMPGQELFQYYDEEGEIRAIDSADVNDYLKEISGDDFTAKDFRTWSGTALATALLWECGPCKEEVEAKQKIVETVREVAGQLGNTPAVCRKCYIHPVVIDTFLDGTMADILKGSNARSHSANALQADEHAVMRLLKYYLKKS